MARGRKAALTLNEQLESVTAKINELENSLKELKNTKKDLEAKIKQERLVELDNLINEKGISIEEVKALLNK